MVRAILVRDASKLGAHLSGWKDLARNACEPNIFYEPEFLLPCLQELGAAANISVVLVFALVANGQAPVDRLIGLFPFLQVRMHRLVRLPILKSLTNGRLPHVYLGTPVVHREHAAAAVDGVLDLLDRRPDGLSLLEWHGHGTDGPFARQLMVRLRARNQPVLMLPGSHRCLFRRQPAAGTGAHVSHARRKRLDSQYRRLERLGAVGFQRLAPGDAVDAWIAGFLELEASGWKGRSGTALASSESGRRFFQRVCRLLHAQDRLMMHKLTLDGRSIAANCMLLAADRSHAFAFKVAYDERFAKFSPGIQMKLRVLDERQAADDGAATIDSCTAPDSALWNTFHLDERRVGHVLVGANRRGVRVALAAAERTLEVWQWLHLRWRGRSRPALSEQP